MENDKEVDNEKDVKEFFNLGDIWRYIIGKKKSSKKDINIKMMHWMNRVAILVFIIALIVWIVKRLS